MADFSSYDEALLSLFYAERLHAALYERYYKGREGETERERERKTIENRGAGLQRPFTGDRDK